jgi:hypothetical protein
VHVSYSPLRASVDFTCARNGSRLNWAC